MKGDVVRLAFGRNGWSCKGDRQQGDGRETMNKAAH
jgi:hypothetical protein